MSLLKDKPLKKCHTDNRKMIDDIHKDIIKDMNDKELNEYYLDNGLLLDGYYRNDNITNNDTSSGWGSPKWPSGQPYARSSKSLRTTRGTVTER